VEGEQNLEILHHDRSRDVAFVEEHTLDILCKKVSGPDAQRRVAVPTAPGVRRILHLFGQP
jgi:hypothetical protein